MWAAAICPGPRCPRWQCSRKGPELFPTRLRPGAGGGRLFFCPLRHSFLSSSVSVTSNPPRRIMLCSWIKLDNCPSLKPGATHGPRGASGVPPGGGVTCAEPHLCRVPQSRNREARRAAPPGPVATPRGRSLAASLGHFHSHFNQKDSSRPSPGLGLCAVSPAVPRPLTSSPGRCPSRFPWGPVASAPPCACVAPVHTSTVRASRSQTAESRAFLLCPVSQGEAGAGEAGVCHDVLAHRCHRRKVQSRMTGGVRWVVVGEPLAVQRPRRLCLSQQQGARG